MNVCAIEAKHIAVTQSMLPPAISHLGLTTLNRKAPVGFMNASIRVMRGSTLTTSLLLRLFSPRPS